MSGKNNFVTLDHVVAKVLLEIGDEENRRYYVRAAQWSLDFFRRINMSYSPFYLERKVTVNQDLYYFDTPNDSVKILSVGIYRNGEFWPFTKKPDLSILPVDVEDGIYESDTMDGVSIPDKGHTFGFNGANIGYWKEDTENCRVFVRNYRYSSTVNGYEDYTSAITDKVIVRYKTTGLDCSGDICIPVEADELIAQYVYYKFMRKNIPVQVTADEKDRQERIVNSLQEDYETLKYEPHNFWEVRDMLFGSLNSTARR